MNFVARIKGILFNCKAEWATIDRESGEPASLFLGYVAELALIPALAGFIGASVVGVSVSVGSFRVPLVPGLVNAFIGYLFSFVIVYVVALIVDALAPSFRTERHFPSALKLAVYSFTPVWLAGIFLVVPGLRFLTILALYGCYLVWTGLPILMRTPRDRAPLYAVAIVVCALIVTLLLALLQGAIAALPRAV